VRDPGERLEVGSELDEGLVTGAGAAELVERSGWEGGLVRRHSGEGGEDEVVTHEQADRRCLRADSLECAPRTPRTLAATL
jgi:hypothetical protein